MGVATTAKIPSAVGVLWIATRSGMMLRDTLFLVVGAFVGGLSTFALRTVEDEGGAEANVRVGSESTDCPDSPSWAPDYSPRNFPFRAEACSCEGEQEALQECEYRLGDTERFAEWLKDQPLLSPTSHAVGLADEELEFMARICEVRIETPQPLGQLDIKQLEMTPDEVEAYEQALAEVSQQTELIMKDAYTRAYGEAPDGAEVSLLVLRDALRPSDAGLRRRIAEERAGLREPPPADQVTPYEQAFRAKASRGDRLEDALASRIGRDRARQLRVKRGSWPGGVGMHYRGCEDEESQAGD